jgi:iron complex transport system ATP-binding protein
MSSAYAMKFSDVSARRGGVTVLDGITFGIRPGESVAILGPNGSGKSTLIKLMTRELYPDDGKLQLFGRPSMDVYELRLKLGIVSNDWQAIFTRDMSGFEAVLSGFFSSVGVWQNHHVTPAMVRRVRSLLKRWKLGPLAERPMHKISSGQARKLLVARALVHDPGMLLFDEPTNSLDLAAQHALRRTMRTLAKSGIGIVLATHHLADIIPEIKRVIVLKHGRIAADGPKDEVLTAVRLKDLFGVPLEVVKRAGFYHAF